MKNLTRLTYQLNDRAANLFSIQKSFTTINRAHTSRPDITISRDPGSGGREVAKLVARTLGYKLLDKALLVKLAKELGIPAKEFANVDEHTRNWIWDLVQGLLNPNYVSDIRYITHLKALLAKASSEDDVVIVGRGANFVLKPTECLRVRITASFNNRVANTVKYEGMTKAHAIDHVTHVQHRRDSFIRQYFSKNPYRASAYDLIINTDSISLKNATKLIIEVYHAKFHK